MPHAQENLCDLASSQTQLCETSFIFEVKVLTAARFSCTKNDEIFTHNSLVHSLFIALLSACWVRKYAVGMARCAKRTVVPD